MSLPSRFPHSSCHNSFSNLFGFSKKQNVENESKIINASDNHEIGLSYELIHEQDHPSDRHHDQHDDENSVDDFSELAKSVTFT